MEASSKSTPQLDEKHVVEIINNVECDNSSGYNAPPSKLLDNTHRKLQVRYADRFVDPAFGFCAGINFFVFEAILIPFEVTAFNIILHFWTDKIPVEAVIAVVLSLYVALNLFAVKFYGEAEFWLSIGKVILAVSLIFFTFVTMVGGNPLREVYGFRNFDPTKVAGAPFAEYIETGSLGRLMGFIACLTQASFTIVGPDYVSMTAGEAANPRQVLPRAFKGVLYRLFTFFILGSLCVGIVVPYDDEKLRSAISNARPGAGSSPYVIAMERLQIPALPHIVNFLILISVFSAGNTYVYCASRTLYGLALEGKMPKALTRCTRAGVPIYCVAVTVGISLLSFLQVSNNSAKVLQWYYALFGTLIMAFISGYEVFLPGRWDVPTFIFSYTMLAVLPVLFVFWKVTRKTKMIAPDHVTFFVEERAEVDSYESACVESPATSISGRIERMLF
ncbi:hypothetical protein ONZ45_g12500 [Pleurotus djamor]|nr:hypothetical protein ONZ45_g12500 [Pleurotus djamor]